jgi:hypothetical protein
MLDDEFNNTKGFDTQLLLEIFEAVKKIETKVNRRRRIKPMVQRFHRGVLAQTTRCCPYCQQVQLVTHYGQLIPDAGEYDHFISSELADRRSTWLICTRCHDLLTKWRRGRHTHKADAMVAFLAYQRLCDQFQEQGELFAQLDE